MTTSPKLVFGGTAFMTIGDHNNVDNVEELLNFLYQNEIKSIDTAPVYDGSESILGNAGASSRFSIDTKHPGGLSPEPATKESVLAFAEESLKKLQTDQVDVYYLHAPDRRIPLEETLSGVNELYKAGKFKRFGLSNFLASEIEEVVNVSRNKGYVLPTVYQGNYSAIARRAETEILPTLRKYDIAFIAYSPIAGGLLCKDVENLVATDQRRWDPSTLIGGTYHALYNRPKILDALKVWDEISKDFSIPKVELAYRWIVYNSELKGELGDGVTIGSRNTQQLENALLGLENGPLSPAVVTRIEEIWKIAEADAPLDNFNDFISLHM